jgi:hypothetical protein
MASNGFNQAASSTYSQGPEPEIIEVTDYLLQTGYFIAAAAQDVISIGTFTDFLGQFPLVVAPAPNTDSHVQTLTEGSFGLGYFTPENSGPNNLLSQYFLANPTEPRKASYYLEIFSDYGPVGNITFGDDSLYQSYIVPGSTIKMQNIGAKYNRWSVAVQNIASNGRWLGYNGLLNIDLATPFLTLPTAAFFTLAQVLGYESAGGTLQYNPSTGGYYFDIACSNATQLYTLTMWIGGWQEYSIPPSQLVLGIGVDCISLIVGMPNLQYWTLGGTAQLTKLIELDFDNNEISISTLLPSLRHTS